ncbi:hypothetical protein AYO38_04725 [bacterium SCGC AG-212-C10]|nr:hypothetical protein AYO38_04725 [bacterium SCGC AG-212-C10]
MEIARSERFASSSVLHASATWPQPVHGLLGAEGTREEEPGVKLIGNQKEHECTWREQVALLAEGTEQLELRVDRLNRELQRLHTDAAFEDPDSGVGNRQQFNRDIVRAISASRRTSVPCSIALFEVNTRDMPPELASLATRDIGWKLVTNGRVEDSVSQVDDDLFAVVLCNATLNGAERYGERLGIVITTTEVGATGDPQTYAQVDIGVAQWNEQMGSVDALFSAAEESILKFRADLASELREWQ